MITVALHVAIQGRVQGVGYRAWVADEATRRKLEGWVHNRRDGSVEAVFSAPEEVVAAMIEACRRGPALARVETVNVQPANTDLLGLRRSGDRFSLLPTV